jgi:SPP1 family predicted phage head-tail adaptor
MIAAGKLTHRYELQRAVQTRNSSGENVPTWEKVLRFMGSYEQTSYAQSEQARQVQGNRQAEVVCRKFSGIDAAMRLVCLTRGNSVMSISSIVEEGGNGMACDLRITVEEAVA